MPPTKRIAIILSDTLQSIGLQSILTDFFSPVEVCYYPTFEAFSESNPDMHDYYFTHSDTFVLNLDFFLPRRSKTVVLTSSDKTADIQGSYTICTISNQELIIEQLQQLFSLENGSHANIEGNKDLSSREVDVLQLIVKGSTNKEIADRLSISHNTVLTHRKNITAKLGIKTVSGLTFYAIMNGIISGDDIEL